MAAYDFGRELVATSDSAKVPMITTSGLAPMAPSNLQATPKRRLTISTYHIPVRRLAPELQ
jgi:hypothetical protein